MNPNSKFEPPTEALSRRGVALVITLAAVVLLTLVLMAFFSKAILNRQISFSSANMARADQMARGALDLILGELRQEIVEGSNPADLPYYTPQAPDKAMPAKLGVSGADSVGAKTIVKVSGDAVPIRPGGSVAGSPVLLTDVSSNGRSITSRRWFEEKGPRLGLQTGMPTWLLITRGNGIKTPAVAEAKNTGGKDYLIGRFAYTVYDISGRLDANVAGYPSSTSGQAKYKTSSSYADLSQIDSTLFKKAPGESIDKLVSWRNALIAGTGSWDAAKAAYFGEWATGLPKGGAPDHYDKAMLLAAGSGYKSVCAGDNAFLSRNDLLRGAADAIIPDAPQLFTVFSRSVNAPSWRPTANSSNLPNFVSGAVSENYLDNANAAGKPNRFILKVARPSPAKVVHYNDDGTIEPYSATDTDYSYKARAGDPAIPRRFSLAKLKWLSWNGPSTTAFASGLSPAEREAAIRQCFGLVWHPSSGPNDPPYWEYKELTSASPLSIKTLEEVAQDVDGAGRGREPNFFELLKAGILRGSLGQHPGSENVTPGVGKPIPAGGGPGGWKFGPEAGDMGYSQDKDRHVLQIGANMIDQADPDSYPTAILFDVFPGKKVYNLLSGNENLPYLQRLFFVAGEMPAGKITGWWQPEIWNPHQPNSGTAGNTPAAPTHFRVRAYQECKLQWRIRNNVPETWSTPVTTAYDAGDGPTLDGVVYFKDNNVGTASSTFYPKPSALYTIHLDNAQGSTQSKNQHDGVSKYQAEIPGVPTLANANAMFAGILAGQVNAPPDPQRLLANIIDIYGCPVRMTVAVECWDGSAWRPYSFIARTDLELVASVNCYPKAGTAAEYLIGANPTNINQSAETNYYLRQDSRTDRFSVGKTRSNARPNNSGQTPGNTIEVNNGNSGKYDLEVCPPKIAAGFTADTSSFFYDTVTKALDGYSHRMLGDWAVNVKNPAGVGACYTDPDGVVRPGDGVYRDASNATSKGDGFMLAPDTFQPGSVLSRRAVILNRPFLSLGELGYVFRDLPFKTLDFFSNSSGDAGLLDLFAVSDQPPTVAGRINPNTADAKVLKSIIAGAMQRESGAVNVSAADAENVSAAIASTLADPNRSLQNPADLATGLGPMIKAGFEANPDLAAKNANTGNNSYLEAPVRALSSSSGLRTWNLLIDVVAQTGHLSPGAGSLKDFVVEGEKRYWLHVAIDRFTGKIVDRQCEPVYEQ